jgi:hypothetical protein
MPSVILSERATTIRQALYHHDRGRKYRPTRHEIESGDYTCPSCQGTLRRVKLRHEEHGFSCKRCHWTIHRDDIFVPGQGEEPTVREPGDATREPDEEEASDELAVADAVFAPEVPGISVAQAIDADGAD